MIWSIVMVLLSAILVSCAPGLSSSLRVKPEGIEFSDPRTFDHRDAGCVRIDEILDQRKSAEIGKIDGRALVADGSVVTSVERSVAKAFSAKSTRNDGCTELRGELREWIVEVIPAFPQSKAESRCALTLSVDPTETSKGYRATYTGSSTRTHPFVDRELVETTLDEALEECLKSAINDEAMRRAIGW